MAARLRFLGQIVSGHDYELVLLAATGCSLVQVAAVQTAFAALLTGVTVNTEQSSDFPDACRVRVHGQAPSIPGPIPAEVPVSNLLSLIKVPGMAVVEIRDTTTGTVIFPETATVLQQPPVPQVSPPKAPAPGATSTTAETDNTGAVIAVAAVAAVVLALVLR